MHSAYNSGGSSEKERHFRGFDNSSNGVNADGVASLYYREERAVLWSNAWRNPVTSCDWPLSKLPPVVRLPRQLII